MTQGQTPTQDFRSLQRVHGRHRRCVADCPSGVRGRAGAVEFELAKLDPANLSRQCLRQLGHEFDAAWIRVGGEAFADVAFDLVGERLGWLVFVCEDDECFDDVARSSSGDATTAASRTSACSSQADSTSNGPIR